MKIELYCSTDSVSHFQKFPWLNLQIWNLDTFVSLESIQDFKALCDIKDHH